MLLCGLALPRKEKWERIMTGDADVFCNEFFTPQTIRTIRECINGSQGSLTALISTSVDESYNPEDFPLP